MVAARPSPQRRLGVATISRNWYHRDATDSGSTAMPGRLNRVAEAKRIGHVDGLNSNVSDRR